MAKALDGWKSASEGAIRRAAEVVGLDPEAREVALLEELCLAIEGFPRHMSIHVGGMVISAAPIASVVPVEPAAMANRTVIAWDKDDAGAAGLVKIDLLGLGMLTLISEGIRLVREERGVEIDLARLGFDDPEVYDMLCRADTVGVFQVESRAQMNMLPSFRQKLKVRSIYVPLACRACRVETHVLLRDKEFPESIDDVKPGRCSKCLSPLELDVDDSYLDFLRD